MLKQVRVLVALLLLFMSFAAVSAQRSHKRHARRPSDSILILVALVNS